MRFGLIILALVSCTSRGTAEGHLGAVSDVIVAGGENYYSCSQAGIFAGGGDKPKLFANVPMRVTSIAIAPSKPALVFFGGGSPGVAGSVGKLRATADETPALRKIAKDLVYDLAVSPDGRLIAAACADGKVRVCGTEDLSPANWTIRHSHTATARAVAFSADGKWLASAGLDGVLILSSAVQKEKPNLLVDHTAGVECLVFSPDSQRIASGSKDSKVRLHEVSGKLIRTYRGIGMESEPVAGRVSARILSLAWNGESLVAGTSKGTLYRLSQSDATKERLSPSFSGPIYALAFDPEGTLLAGGQSRLHVLEAKNVKEVDRP